MNRKTIQQSKITNSMIGSRKYSDKVCYPEWNLQWGNKSFNLLGIIFHVDLHRINKMTFDKKLVKLKSLIHGIGEF